MLSHHFFTYSCLIDLLFLFILPIDAI
jgi:hypothetical protein